MCLQPHVNPVCICPPSGLELTPCATYTAEFASLSPFSVSLSGHHIHGEKTLLRAPALGPWVV